MVCIVVRLVGRILLLERIQKNYEHHCSPLGQLRHFCLQRLFIRAHDLANLLSTGVAAASCEYEVRWNVADALFDVLDLASSHKCADHQLRHNDLKACAHLTCTSLTNGLWSSSDLRRSPLDDTY